ncbi:MAG: hypothetical protein VKO21_08925 [Candidatus Sericytochromatia bacterium]|nr:hypothetical protein [Candidatus Sericytochromatia bacterium]
MTTRPALLAATLASCCLWTSAARAETLMPPDPAPADGEVASLIAGWGFPVPNPPGSDLKIDGQVEWGALSVLTHKIQYGSQGTVFDYVYDGRQDTLFPFQRLQAGLTFGERHKWAFLYQPIDLRTQTVLSDDERVEEVTFRRGTPLDIRYGFDAYRTSYLYDFDLDPDRELALGLSLQIRNAISVFSSGNGEQRVVRTDLGPVPLLKFRARQPMGGRAWWATDIDGSYATSAGFNGVDFPFEGALLDASLRTGLSLSPNYDVFANLRYLGGGAKGTERIKQPFSDGFAENWLQTLTVSFGIGFR